MTIQISLTHKTDYIFDRAVGLAPHTIRLRPAVHCKTPILAYSLKVEPKEHFINWQQDPFGNHVARLVFPGKTKKLSIEVSLTAEMTVINPFDFFLEPHAEKWPFTYTKQELKELLPYLEKSEDGPLLQKALETVPRKIRRTQDFLVALNQKVQKQIGYGIRLEPGIQSCEETLSKRTGSCRDSAWLLVQLFRHLGFATRFVSGYLVQLKADIEAIDGPSGPEQDFTDLHAWVEVYLPGAGWVGLDPTSGLFAGEGHIPLSCTPDPASSAPVSGATDKCEVEFAYSNEVSRIREDPRVTRPYSDDEWKTIMSLGQRVDDEFAEGDVRLTMGGEPTFVAMDDMDGPEWNTEALSDRKLELANRLYDRMVKCFSHSPLRHFGQGKWYPGEPIPRWILSCVWRTDGEPIWKDQSLFADTSKDYGYTHEQAETFAKALAKKLKVAQKNVMGAFEDVHYLLWKEGTLPSNTDPFDSKLDDALERDRLRRLFSAGLDTPAGYVLPIKWAGDEEKGKWKSNQWPLKRERLYLIPGDSPLGLRLPLASLPWVAPEEREISPERDPFAPFKPLANINLEPTESDREQVQDEYRQAMGNIGGSTEVIHTAMCIETRKGRLHVFMPPCDGIEQYLRLLRSIESVAGELEIPVVIEGYEIPSDPRLKAFQVTPDPGVIEVNIHPAFNWTDLVNNTEVLYEEARQVGLGAEKFMLDGRHTGTGGGNHVTLGARAAEDSPILRRPDLLRSLVTFWQHHPCLSYLFSGQFIGPTSQSPRVDEARDDNLHELEIAFQQIDELENPMPWQVDRIMRNLLIDMTGNTHRAEFCIDKLYSADSASGRRGLLEFRAFEMPPHNRLNIVQMLLIRTLVAHFWKTPYRGKPLRWGTDLHDRFMLPHYIWADFVEVCEVLNRAGYEIDSKWYEPFFEFRFPRYGTIHSKGVELELRGALEPWHVLGEEMSATGTARYVDSSIERLQVKVTGYIEGKHTITCNGHRVPMRPTDKRGEYVAGIRFKAWQPPSGLHPMIPLQSPVVIDIIDTLNQRAIGGCTYHVEHPGGNNPETFPINANEAEARRVARFWSHGHSHGTVPTDIKDYTSEYSYTLDLRRYR